MTNLQEFSIDDKQFSGYLALPKARSGPGVLVLHAWWGLNDFIKELCDRFAEEGFVALAPDYYGGKIDSTIEGAKKLRGEMDRKAVDTLLMAAVDMLREHKAVDGDTIGVIGFSLGAHLGFGLSRNKPNDISALVAYYGKGGGHFNKLKASVQGHFAEHDSYGARPALIEKFRTQLDADGVEYSFFIYPGTQHWFFEADRDVFNIEAAQLSWERTLKFLGDKL